AAGFDGGTPKRKEEGNVLRRDAKPQQTQAETRAAAAAVATRRKDESDPGADKARETERESVLAGARTTPAEATTPKVAPASVPHYEDDDLDIPDFLK
ncbi:MAG: hypothetical protein Q7J48_16120, partial [Nocardioides sp.]|nr:hypothetical protein [Nocardioides sp.]